ncbi:MAG: DinB family protein [Ktedonobacteraceae bacterium]
MIVDFAAVRAGQISYADATRTLQHADLCHATDELFAELESALAHATDATISFVPRDSAATDDNEQGWTVSHVIAHFTSTLEGTAAGAAMLARGVKLEGRSQYETPWESLSTLRMVKARLQESHRMCNAFLSAWPDEPHLDLTVEFIPAFGPMNAIGLDALGIAHAQQHLDQIRDVVRQASAA